MDIEAILRQEARVIDAVPIEEHPEYSWWRAASLGRIILQFANGNRILNTAESRTIQFFDNYLSARNRANGMVNPDISHMGKLAHDEQQALDEIVGKAGYQSPAIIFALEKDFPSDELIVVRQPDWESTGTIEGLARALSDLQRQDPRDPVGLGGGHQYFGEVRLDMIDEHSRAAIQEIIDD